MPDVIEAWALTKVYDGGVDVAALRGVDLRIAPATFLAIIGPSGSGKSTLLNVLAGLELPTTGKTLFDGVDLGALGEDGRAALRRDRVGFVFQQFNLLPIFSAIENVALPLRLKRIGEQEAVRRAEEALTMVGLAGRRDHIPSQLSGGEQQRVAIARALVAEPAIIFADEPTGNLDSASGDGVIVLLRRLVDERALTVVMVTHDQAAASCADRVIALRDGQIVGDFDPRAPAGAGAGEEARA